MSTQWWFGDTQPRLSKVATAQAAEVGDLVTLLPGNTITRAEDTGWDTNLLTTQQNFAAGFIGVSGQRKVATVAKPYGNSKDNYMRVDTAGVFRFDCAAATLLQGEMVGPAKDTGNALLSQKVVKVTNQDAAIGVVAEDNGTSGTTVLVEIWSTKAAHARNNS